MYIRLLKKCLRIFVLGGFLWIGCGNPEEPESIQKVEQAYGTEWTNKTAGHNKIIAMAVEYLQYTNEAAAKNFDLDGFYPAMIQGSYYADHHGLKCDWDGALSEVGLSLRPLQRSVN